MVDFFKQTRVYKEATEIENFFKKIPSVELLRIIKSDGQLEIEILWKNQKISIFINLMTGEMDETNLPITLIEAIKYQKRLEKQK